ncbi:hypothetical protein L2E82_14022 [Cichorium intybus]|uniref:Uncharacterized protein n=1 Tax=Cichorium intybus TaxID=13427 RepID=A0ACB9F042_CICIN|nr:hypothetical protein L2E82_14022 [Cichorium intybus]
MLKHKENSPPDDVSGAEVSHSKETELISEENQMNPGENSEFSEKDSDKSSPFKLGTSQGLSLSNLSDNSKLGVSDDGKSVLKGKSVVSEDYGDHNLDENRWVERDFLQLSGSSSKREVEDDQIHVMSRDKRPKLETLDLSLSLPDVSLSISGSNRVQFQNGDHSVTLKPGRSLQSIGRSNSNNPQTTFSNDFSTASLSYSYSHQFSHNPSCSMTRNSTENHEIWNGGEGTNGSVHSRFRPIGDGSVALVQSNRTNSDTNLSLFPSELVARPIIDNQSGNPMRISKPERILQEIASESIQIMARIIQELPDETIESAKDYLKKLITLPIRKDELVRLQLRLERRSDLTSETLSKSNKNQLQILVSIRTSIATFVSNQTRLPIHELIEIFLYERCKNINCKRLLPVEDCECKICSTTKGFCSKCMCPICLNFDRANNTCSWVCCNACSHWCHVACGLQNNLIKPGPVKTPVQFHCTACGHASEMFSSIKDAFKSYARQWSRETLTKELDCISKIFKGSFDFKGKELHFKTGEMISKLENKIMSPEDVCTFIIQFFNYADGVSEFPQNTIKPRSEMIGDEWSVKSMNKDGFGSVENLMRIKEVEAIMFQKKADEARKEAEGYKQMIRVKIEKLDEEYGEKSEELCLSEVEERRRQKVVEFKVLENAHFEYYKMMMRMQSEIAGLLQRMENTTEVCV